MKKALLLLLAVLVLMFVGISFSLAQEAAKPTEAAAGAKAAPAEQPKVETAKPETISGTIQMVVAEKKCIIIADSKGIPYNFKVTGATRIKVAGKKAKLDELGAHTNKSASVKFLPLHAGNIAQCIEVSE
jgi:hypothetical protein